MWVTVIKRGDALRFEIRHHEIPVVKKGRVSPSWKTQILDCVENLLEYDADLDTDLADTLTLWLMNRASNMLRVVPHGCDFEVLFLASDEAPVVLVAKPEETTTVAYTVSRPDGGLQWDAEDEEEIPKKAPKPKKRPR